jgi:hypothetical protein
VLEFIFDVGFDGLLPGHRGERSRARRAAKTLDEFERTGTTTFPGAMRSTGPMNEGYLTTRAASIVFSEVSGSELTHTVIDLGAVVSFWPMANKTKTERGLSKWWTIFRLHDDAVSVVLACAPNGSTSLLKVMADCRIPQLEL